MKKRVHLTVTFPFIIILGSVLFFLFLPYLFDLYLFPRIISKLPYTEKELSLSRISPWTIRGTVILADQDRQTLSVPKFELHYTPSSLFRREIAKVILDSASLQLEIQDGLPVIRGLGSNNSPGQQEGNTSPFLLPLAAKDIILKNCSVTLHRDQQNPLEVILDGRFTLNFLEQPEDKKLLSSLSGQLKTRGSLALGGKIGMKRMGDGYGLDMQLQSPDLGQLFHLFSNRQDLRLKGGLSLAVHAKLDNLAQQLTSYEVAVKFPGFTFGNASFHFGNNSPEKPMTMQLTGNLEKSVYVLNNIVLTKPEGATLNLQGEIEILERTFKGTGQLFSERTNSTFTMNYSGVNHESESEISYQLASDAFTIGDAVTFSSLKAEGNIAINSSTLAANINSRIPEIDLKKNKTKLINISLQLPFQYPALSKGRAGDFKIDKILYQGTNSGKLKATLSPSVEGIAFTTLFTTPFIPGLKFTCAGSAPMIADISAQCRIPKTQFDSSTFPSFIPLPDELFLSGELAAKGEFNIANRVPAGKLTVNYSNGTLTQSENVLSDINFGVVFPHLPMLQSSPSQLCTIGSLDLGKVKLSDAKIRFRIEDNQAIFLEKTRLSWCGGKVETGGFTLSKDMKELETTLYCDRLGFTELLGQFGIDKAEGQGSLNGRLPLLINNKGLVFDDGFLFSTPGNSGIVRFNDTLQLRRGIPDIDKSAYLDYSMKALENFSYNWTKLSFNSQDDDLLIKMQLDGKPAEPLPFGYKKGQIIPSNTGPGLQHPIRLDVNFRLPLQDLFQYGKNIQSIMENM